MKIFIIICLLFVCFITYQAFAGGIGLDLSLEVSSTGGGEGGSPPSGSVFLLANKTDSFLLANKSDKLIIH